MSDRWSGTLQRLDFRLLLVVAVAVGLWLPLGYADWFWGHEKFSYVYRSVEWATEMRRGLLYPRWCPDLYGGYGSPLFMFYAPVPYGAAGFLTAFGLHPIAALKTVALLVSIASGLGMYGLVYTETRQPDASLLSALVYLAAPYRIADLFERGDIGEFTSLALLPIVIALYRAAALEARPRRSRWLAVGAAVAHAMLIMTHPILGFWSTVLIGLIVAATAVGLIRNGMRRRALLSIGVLASAPALAAIYVVPAMVYRAASHTDIMATGWSNPQHQWILFQTLFAKDAPFYTANFFRIGPVIAAALATVTIALALHFREATRALGWMALSIALVGLTLPQGSWFWAPGLIPTAQFVQFPWRMLGPALVTGSTALGVGMAALSHRWSERARTAVAIAGGATMLFALAWPYVTLRPASSAGQPATADELRAGVYAAMDEDGYLPRTAPRAPSAPRRELVRNANGATFEHVLSDGAEHLLTLRSQQGGASATLALHAFPGWRVETLSGPAGVSMDHDDEGLLRLHLAAPGEYRLRVWYGSPPAATLGAALSALAALALGLLLAHEPLRAWWRSRRSHAPNRAPVMEAA